MLHAQAERGATLNVDGGRLLLKTAGVLLVWSGVALFLPYDRFSVLLSVATLAPAAAVIAVTRRIARRYRALLRG